MNHVVILLKDPAAAAQVRGAHDFLKQCVVIGRLRKIQILPARKLVQIGRSLRGTVVEGSLVTESLVGHLGNLAALIVNGQVVALTHLSDDHGIQIPFAKDFQDLFLTFLFGNQ